MSSQDSTTSSEFDQLALSELIQLPEAQEAMKDLILQLRDTPHVSHGWNNFVTPNEGET